MADNLIEWQVIERMHGEEIILPFTYDYVAWPDVDAAMGLLEKSSQFDSDHNALFSLSRFEGMLVNRRYNVAELVVDIEVLEEKTRQLIERLENQRK